MNIKEGVSLQGLKLVMRHALMAGERIWTEYGQELTITSGTETYPHRASSLHYYGYALDLRTRDFPPEIKIEVYQKLKEALHSIPSFRVIKEPTHIHVEWRGTIE